MVIFEVKVFLVNDKKKFIIKKLKKIVIYEDKDKE